MGKLHFTPLNYLPIFTFTSKVSNVTLNPPKLSNCGNLTPLTLFLFFPKCPYHIFSHILFLTKKNPKKRKRKNQMGWFGGEH
jgi:hypothetical protein